MLKAFRAGSWRRDNVSYDRISQGFRLLHCSYQYMFDPVGSMRWRNEHNNLSSYYIWNNAPYMHDRIYPYERQT